MYVECVTLSKQGHQLLVVTALKTDYLFGILQIFVPIWDDLERH